MLVNLIFRGIIVSMPKSTWKSLFLLLVVSNLVLIFAENESVTKEERELVTQLRPLVDNVLYKDYMREDNYLVKFLRVRNYNIRKTIELIETTMNWRKEMKMDTILLEDFTKVEREMPLLLDDNILDKDGRPVVIFNIGGTNVRKVTLAGHGEIIGRLYNALLELLAVNIREVNYESKHKNITKAIGIVDMAKFNMKQHACILCNPLVPSFFKSYERYYPETFHKVYVINTPRIFLPYIDMSKPLLSSSTRNTMEFYDFDSTKWKQILLNAIPASNLPVFYGGNNTNATLSTFSQFRRKNRYIKAAYEKLTDKNDE